MSINAGEQIMHGFHQGKNLHSDEGNQWINLDLEERNL